MWKRDGRDFSPKTGRWQLFSRENKARTILDLAFIQLVADGGDRASFTTYAFGFQRANPDVIFGHWLHFDRQAHPEAVA